jgi:hypothetical protein
MFRIYNDWLVAFCRRDPDRFIGLACLPYGDIDGAVKEIQRVAKLGLRGMELSCSWDMEPMWHPVWEPLWKAVHEVNLPLHFHTFPAIAPGKLDQQTGPTRRAAFFTVVSSFQTGTSLAISRRPEAGPLARLVGQPSLPAVAERGLSFFRIEARVRADETPHSAETCVASVSPELVTLLEAVPLLKAFHSLRTRRRTRSRRSASVRPCHPGTP